MQLTGLLHKAMREQNELCNKQNILYIMPQKVLGYYIGLTVVSFALGLQFPSSIFEPHSVLI